MGLSGAGAFKLKQIGAPYVVLEIMRTSCPHCQEQAPGMNKFYHLVQGSDLKGKVKFLGVAQGCSANEVKQFKKRHKVPFPMLADPNGSVGQALHIEGVPTTVLLNRERPGPPGACGQYRQSKKGPGRIAAAGEVKELF